MTTKEAEFEKLLARAEKFSRSQRDALPAPVAKTKRRELQREAVVDLQRQRIERKPQ